jgi:O-antigen ligase
LQVTGAGLGNPFVNEDPGDVSGTFANRNHFALLLAIGCLLAPAWAFREGRHARWRAPVALALALVFILMILASGSRAGILVGIIALILGLLLSWRSIRRELRHAPRWALPALIAAIIGTVALFVLISVAADRAASISRALEVEVGADIRSRSLPIVLSMIQDYFPFGNGYGTFDSAFRVHEPFGLLKLTYFNHAHDDFLEVVMNGGVPGLSLLVAALAWWLLASVRAWRSGSAPQHLLPKLGSAILLLVFVASIFDYPARTPIIMSVIAIAAMWLGGISFTPARATSIGARDELPSFPKDSQAHA